MVVIRSTILYYFKYQLLIKIKESPNRSGGAIRFGLTMSILALYIKERLKETRSLKLQKDGGIDFY